VEIFSFSIKTFAYIKRATTRLFFQIISFSLFWNFWSLYWFFWSRNTMFFTRWI